MPPTAPVIDDMPDCFVPGSNEHLHATSIGASSFSWNFPYCGVTYDPTGNDPFPQECWYNYTGNGSASGAVFVHVGVNGGSVSVFASNGCGTSSINRPITFCDSEPGGPGSTGGPIHPLIGGGSGATTYGQIYPNPTSDFLNLSLVDNYFNPALEKQVYIKTQSGNHVGYKAFTSNQHQIGVSNLQPGTYSLYVVTQERVVYVAFVRAK